MFKLSASILSLAACAAVFPCMAAPQAKSDTPADYANALPLQIKGNQGVVSVQLPASVYLHAQTGRLDDLRVFDAKGVAQPYSLYHPSPREEVRRSQLSANIFPVYAQKSAAGTSAPDLTIQTRPDGSVSSVQMHAGKTTNESALDSLVLDFGPWQTEDQNNGRDGESRIEALRFAIPENRTNYSAEVWLAVSDDLKSWKTAGASELSWLSNDDAQMLANDRLEISPQRFRYARLSWRRGEPVPFPRIQAELAVSQGTEPARETVWLSPSAGRQTGDLVYRAGPALPAELIDLRLGDANIVFPMMLGTYAERLIRKNSRATETVFRPLLRATFYRIAQDGETRRSAALRVNTGAAGEWVIRPLNPASTVQPELGLSWQPATLVFLAGGAPPYTLRFGRADAVPASLPLSQVAPGFSAGELDRLEKAQVGELQTSDAAASLKNATDDTAQTRTIILWGALLLGVAVLATLAWRLIRQMNSGDSPR